MRTLLLSSFILNICLSSLSIAETIILPKTGQIKCYDSVGTEISCKGTGQDGEMQAGIGWPSPRFTEHLDGTVTDNLTCLIWTKDADLMATIDSSYGNSTLAGAVTWESALTWVNQLSYANMTDWRMPNKKELLSLIDWGQSSGYLPEKNPFTNPQSVYWTSTTVAGDSSYAWVIGFGGFIALHGTLKSNYMHVWPVRSRSDCTPIARLPKTGAITSYYERDDGALQSGSQWPEPRFTDNTDGTVTDKMTNLMWTTNASIPNSSWQDALEYIKRMNRGEEGNFGYINWRLPNIIELESLVSAEETQPALPDSPFYNVGGMYFSSTTDSQIPSSSIVLLLNSGLSFWDGGLGGGVPKDNFGRKAWVVRDASIDLPLAQPLGDKTLAIMAGRTIGQCLFGGFCARTGATKSHTGIDYIVPAGTPIYAVCDGVVLMARVEQINIRGEQLNILNRFTIINHSDCGGFGELFAYYGHITPTVKEYTVKGKDTPTYADICNNKDPSTTPWCVRKGQQIGVVSKWTTPSGEDNSHLHLGLSSNYVSNNWGYLDTEKNTASDCSESSVVSRRDSLFTQGWKDPAILGAELGWNPFTLKGGTNSGNCNAPEQLYIPHPVGESLPYYPWRH